jgi:hypothetical protein
MSITPQKTLIRVYKGNSKTASSTFRYDSISLAKKGYVPISEVWAQGTWGCFAFLIALALCFIFIGFLVFIYMLIVKPEGTLTVTYSLQENKNENDSSKQLDTPLIFFPLKDRTLSNDAFKLFLIDYFDIAKHKVIGQFVMEGKIYDDLEDALLDACDLYEDALKKP